MSENDDVNQASLVVADVDGGQLVLVSGGEHDGKDPNGGSDLGQLDPKDMNQGTIDVEEAEQLVLVHEAPASGEPASKRMKTDHMSNFPQKEQYLDPNLSVKQILFNVNRAICCRLEGIESKLDNISKRTEALENQVNQMSNKETGQLIGQGVKGETWKAKNGSVIVGLPQDYNAASGSTSRLPAGSPAVGSNANQFGPNVTLITLNTKSDYPDGVWLGDEKSPEMRVRVPVSPSDLIHIHSNCRSPEKMALTLLDYLFDRETQATSNLSGMGKHGKKQLDPLMIYGIRCHLIHKFNISYQDWHRIKLNIDSKCRTAFRRRVRGQPLTVKAFRGKGPILNYMGLSPGGNPADITGQSDDSMQHEDVELHIANDQEVNMPVTMQGQHGEIQILHATEEQLAQLQQAHQIQILQAGDLQGIQNLNEDIRVAVSLAASNGQPIQVVTTSTGEVIQVQEQPQTVDDNLIIHQDHKGDSGEIIQVQQASDNSLIIHQEDEPGDEEQT